MCLSRLTRFAFICSIASSGMLKPSCFSAVARLSQSLRQVPKRVCANVIRSVPSPASRTPARRPCSAELGGVRERRGTHGGREELAHLLGRIARGKTVGQAPESTGGTVRTGCRVVGEMRMGRVKDQLVRSGSKPRGRVGGLTACCTSRWATFWHTASESVNGRVRCFRTSPAWSRRESLGEGENACRAYRGVHGSPCDDSGVLDCPVPGERTQENGGDLLNLDRASISLLVKDVDAALSVRADRALPVVALLEAVRAHPIRGDVAVKDLRRKRHSHAGVGDVDDGAHVRLARL